jgi:hypothetical protein
MMEQQEEMADRAGRFSFTLHLVVHQSVWLFHLTKSVRIRSDEERQITTAMLDVDFLAG